MGFPHSAGRYRPGRSLFFPRVVGCICMEELLTRGWYHISSPDATRPRCWHRGQLAAHWLYELQPINNQYMGVGFPHRAGRYRPGGIDFFVPGLLELYINICIYIFFRVWNLILPGCGGTSTLTRGAILAARWLHEPQPITNQWMRCESGYSAGLILSLDTSKTRRTLISTVGILVL